MTRVLESLGPLCTALSKPPNCSRRTGFSLKFNQTTLLDLTSFYCLNAWKGWGRLSHMHSTIGQTALSLHRPSLPTAASLFSLMLVLHAGPQYQLGLSCHHSINGYYPSPPRPALPTPGIDLVTHNSLDHALC